MYKTVQKITSMSRLAKQFSMLLVDSISLVSILYISFIIRMGVWHLPDNNLLWIVIGSPVLALPIFLRFGLYQSVIRYIGFKALWSVGQAVTLYSILWGLIMLMLDIDGTPRSIILINWMLSILVIGGSRILARWLLTSDRFSNDRDKVNVIIYGAGAAGRQLSNALQQSNDYKHVAYVDDNSLIHNNNINGVPVIPFKELSLAIKTDRVSEIFLALPSISRRKRNKIIEILNPLSILVKSLPSVSELAQGKVSIEDLQKVSIKDLLGRNPVKPNEKLLKLKITNKVVLVTGAGGSIGSELCRQIIFLKPKKLILFEITEFFLYQVDRELNEIGALDIEIIPVLGSVRNKVRFQAILECFSVQTVYHSAAYKHVPLVEYNNSEGVLNNIFGTLIAAEVSIASKVETFVLISTDKAVRPTNTMGATKRVSELILQALSLENHSTCFTMVRFGNVLDSSGSVIPLFKSQIKHGGPVTVTDPNMVRFFMTIHEAVELVLQASSMSEGGDVFVLDMGEPVRIYDLAVRMIQLSGLHVLDKNNLDGDIEIIYSGLRPGEKLYEELLVNGNAIKTDNSRIMRAEEAMLDWSTLKLLLDELEEASEKLDNVKIRNILIKIVPEFIPQSHIVDFLN